MATSAESGQHHPSRWYADQSGNIHLNGADLLIDADSDEVSLLPGAVKYVDKIVSSAEVLALNATPITVLPAVGAGKAPQFVGAFVFLDYNSAAYVDEAGEDLVFTQLSAGSVVSQTIDGAEFDGTADCLGLGVRTTMDASETNTLVQNGGFEVTIQSGEWVTGDSPLKIRLFYREVTVSDLEAIA